MKSFNPGDIAILNEKARPMLEHKGWLIPGRKIKIIALDFENKSKRKRWYKVQLIGKSGNIIGESKLPSNWLDLA